MSSGIPRRAALGLIGAGAVGSVAWTGAFSHVRADRSTSVDSAADADAFLALDDLGNVDTVPKVTNRSDAEMSVTLGSPDSGVEFDVHDDGTNDGSSPTFSVGVGSTVAVDVLADGDIAVDFDAELLDPGGSPVGEISLRRTVEAQSQAGQVSITPNVTSVGNSGKYRFELENTGSVDVAIVAIGIRYTTNPNAVEVAGGAVFTVGGDQIVTSSIPFDSADQTTDTRRNFTEDVPLGQGEARTFEFDRFQTASGKGAKMKNDGDEVGIRLYFEDGSTLDEVLAP